MASSKKPVYVLLADDDTNDQTRMQMALNGAEAELKIDLVTNGMQLLDHLVQQHLNKKKPLPDLIITDLYMPFAGALHVLKQIRKRPEFTHIPIYVFSANNDKMIRTQLLENGATEFHQKPGEFTLLQNIVNSIITRTQAVDTPQAV
jgi:CheY-like chemotaxis protein